MPRRVFCRFPHRFRDFCEGLGCFRRSFGPRGPSARRGPKTPRGRTLSAFPPPLATSLSGSRPVALRATLVFITSHVVFLDASLLTMQAFGRIGLVDCYGRVFTANDQHGKPKEARKLHNTSRKHSAHTRDPAPPLYKAAGPRWIDFAQILTQHAEINSEQSQRGSNPNAKPFRS